MKILMAGGGSGGHVTPLRAIITELSKAEADKHDITVVTDRGFYDQTQFLFKNDGSVKLKKIFSGKLRRYNSKSLLWHLIHLPTILLNIRDILYLAIGLVQSVSMFMVNKPDVVFCKGGFVCVPIGLAARLFKVRLVIHDSDTHPGLTNRFLSKWAAVIATGMPAKYYRYPANKTVYTGIPVSKDFRPISEAEKAGYKKKLSFSNDKPLLLVTGGGTGAQILNDITLKAVPELLNQGWQIALITGKNKSRQAKQLHYKLNEYQRKSFKYYEFTEAAPLALAADVIVSRAGATAMQEFANAAKLVLIVPSPYLTGAHQLKNAQMFLEHNAAIVLQEPELELPDKFVSEISQLQANKTVAAVLNSIFAKPEAARELAKVILGKRG